MVGDGDRCMAGMGDSIRFQVDFCRWTRQRWERWGIVKCTIGKLLADVGFEFWDVFGRGGGMGVVMVVEAVVSEVVGQQIQWLGEL